MRDIYLSIYHYLSTIPSFSFISLRFLVFHVRVRALVLRAH